MEVSDALAKALEVEHRRLKRMVRGSASTKQMLEGRARKKMVAPAFKTSSGRSPDEDTRDQLSGERAVWLKAASIGRLLSQ